MRKTISFRFDAADPSLFDESHNRRILSRIRLISILLLLVFPFYLYADFFMLGSVGDPTYRHASWAIHAAGPFLSLLFLLFYRRMNRTGLSARSAAVSFVIGLYVTLYLLLGMTGSLNSQLLTGNVDAYIIILLAVAVSLPISPLRFLFILLGTHTLFLIGLSAVSGDPFTLATKQINTTATVLIAFFISWTFYTLLKRDFFHTRRLKQQESDFRKLFAVNPYPLVLSRLADDRIVLTNEKASRFFGQPDDENRAFFLYPSEEEKERIVGELLERGRVPNRICELAVSPSLSRWVMIQYERIDYRGEPCVLAGFTDITELKEAEAELALHASTDAMTGVMNRGHGMALLQKDLEEAREAARELIVCFVDINDLKEVNDRYGHAEGDALIHMASQVLQRNLDEGDYLFRYGGDEFILVFHKGMPEAARLWESIRDDLQRLNQSRSKPFAVTVSHGLFRFQSGMKASAEELVAYADQEMYKNKTRYKRKASTGEDSRRAAGS
ncbi:hypothetical protein J31TS4_21360 [Paenibacillus sp. J31TS4]|uniref:sensor domain-containing diguanylate cyclase n=1 Tax=Paenibacillus sp. J31TS4 TaxID=2807195 RepID=UPI001B2C44BE|nr:diguanylate cyclase [Paenibacillus sp. J31TS4]GIP38856.1 hypothetical protein J31TS4_21360 [Paenibacillus sp. J31TS4]